MPKMGLLVFAISFYMAHVSCRDTQNNTAAASHQYFDSIKTVLDSIDNKEMEEAKQLNKNKPKFVSVYPLGTFKTLPEIVNSLFGVGSSKEEILNLFGRPELIEPDNINADKEIWYYGKTEIHFKHNIVMAANGTYVMDKVDKFVDVQDLISSEDPIEKKFGLMLLNRYVSVYYSK